MAAADSQGPLYLGFDLSTQQLKGKSHNQQSFKTDLVLAPPVLYVCYTY